MERTILRLVAYPLVYAARAHLPWREVLPFALILLVAAIPVVHPAVFTLATALGVAPGGEVRAISSADLGGTGARSVSAQGSTGGRTVSPLTLGASEARPRR